MFYINIFFDPFTLWGLPAYDLRERLGLSPNSGIETTNYYQNLEVSVKTVRAIARINPTAFSKSATITVDLPIDAAHPGEVKEVGKTSVEPFFTEERILELLQTPAITRP